MRFNIWLALSIFYYVILGYLVVTRIGVELPASTPDIWSGVWIMAVIIVPFILGYFVNPKNDIKNL
jgi:uncharacterized protein YneF (UPF0154 family)